MNTVCDRLIYAFAIVLCLVALLFVAVASPRDYEEQTPVYQGF